MYILSFYEGTSELSFALGRKLFKFPYTYSESIFGTIFTKEQFYKDVFELAAKELGVKLKECEIHAIGVLDIPKIPFEIKKSLCLLTSLPENYVYMTRNMVAVNHSYNSYTPLTLYDSDDNLLANMGIYPNLFSSDTHDVNVKDTLLRSIMVGSEYKFMGTGVLFTGDRFIDFDTNPPLSYLLVFDTVKQPGIFNLRIDKKNFFPHMLMIGLDEEFAPLGTLVNSPGKTECLYKTDVGTSQMIELEPNKLFIVPLERGNEAHILIKNSEGQMEQRVFGGELGVIFDTRDKNAVREYKEIEIDAIIQALNKI